MEEMSDVSVFERDKFTDSLRVFRYLRFAFLAGRPAGQRLSDIENVTTT